MVLVHVLTHKQTESEKTTACFFRRDVCWDVGVFVAKYKVKVEKGKGGGGGEIFLDVCKSILRFQTKYFLDVIQSERSGQ